MAIFLLKKKGLVFLDQSLLFAKQSCALNQFLVYVIEALFDAYIRIL
jgi:hypothetical protein